MYECPVSAPWSFPRTIDHFNSARTIVAMWCLSWLAFWNIGTIIPSTQMIDRCHSLDKLTPSQASWHSLYVSYPAVGPIWKETTALSTGHGQR